MRKVNRINIVTQKLNQAWKLSPDLRLGQLLYAIYGECTDLFNIEDDEWHHKIDEFIKSHILLGGNQNDRTEETSSKPCSK